MNSGAPGGRNPTFADQVIAFNKRLDFKDKLPPDIAVMNPFRENTGAVQASEAFYRKYYSDHNSRGMILGINPGRFGAGLTGVPFTDPKRLAKACQIDLLPPAHEPSSEFIYEVIAACGGPRQFYSKWYINSLCPLGFTRLGPAGKPINYNFYDNPDLEAAALPFMLRTFPKQLAFGIRRDVCFCLGSGKNAAFLAKVNKKYRFFAKIIPLEHPRYIMQYKSKERSYFVEKYKDAFTEQELIWGIGSRSV